MSKTTGLFRELRLKLIPLLTNATFFLPPAWLLGFFVFPLILIWIYSFSEVRNITGFELTWTLKNYQAIFKPVYLQIIFKSLWMAGLTTLICLILGLGVATFVAFNPSQKLKIFFLLLVILPFWTNMLIRTYALIAVFRREGYINKIYLGIGDVVIWGFETLGIEADFVVNGIEPLPLLYNNTAVVFGLVYVNLPFMILPLFGVLDKLDRSYIEASLDLGASKFTTFTKVIVPMISEGIFAGLLITFIPSLGSFLTPDLLGGNDSQMIANVIERQFKGANNWPLGSSFSFLLMYLLFFVVALRSFKRSKPVLVRN